MILWWYEHRFPLEERVKLVERRLMARHTVLEWELLTLVAPKQAAMQLLQYAD